MPHDGSALRVKCIHTGTRVNHLRETLYIVIVNGLMQFSIGYDNTRRYGLQLFDDCMAIVLARNVLRCLAATIRVIGIGAQRQEHPGRIVISIDDGMVQWRISFIVWIHKRGTIVNELLDDIRHVFLRG